MSIISTAPVVASAVIVANGSGSSCTGDQCILIWLAITPMVWFLVAFMYHLFERWWSRLLCLIFTLPICCVLAVPLSLALDYLGFSLPLHIIKLIIQ